MAGNHLHTLSFENKGAVAATEVVIDYDVPIGAKIEEANYVILDGTTNPVRWKEITSPVGSVSPYNASSGTVSFSVGTVAAGTGGYVQVRLTENAATMQTSGPGAYDLEGRFRPSDSGDPAPSEREPRSVDGKAEPSDSIREILALSASADPDRSRPYAMVQGPLAVVPGSLITYTITYGDHGAPGGDVGGGGVFAHIPPGTELVRHEVDRILPNLSEVFPDTEVVLPSNYFFDNRELITKLRI